MNEIKLVVNDNDDDLIELGIEVDINTLDIIDLQTDLKDGVQLNTIATPPTYQAGRYWFDGKNFNFYDNVEGTSIQLGKELLVDVKNNNGASLGNLTVIRYDGSINGVPSAVRAQSDSVVNCRDVAVVTHDIEVGEIGKACFSGLASGDTSDWNVDDKLYVSADTAGALTNVEQPILSDVGVVLISDATNGLILVKPTGIRNIVAIGQSTGSNRTQTLTSTPTSITAFNNNAFEVNVDITHTGTTNLTTALAPASVGASGFYRINFNISITTNNNALYYFEVYLNGVPTGLASVVDVSNNSIDAGNCSFNGISQRAILETDSIEIYAYNDGGTSAVTYTSCLVNIERIGNY